MPLFQVFVAKNGYKKQSISRRRDMNITQSFYNNMASQYDKLFLDWDASVEEQAVILDRIFRKKGFDSSAHILDCACGIGTQTLGLASLGYQVTASDISDGELAEAKDIAAKIEAGSVTVAIKGGENGKTYGSVSTKEIADAAKKQLGLDIDKKKIVLAEPLKTFGTHEAVIKPPREGQGKVKVKVVEG
jgi:SAM-dependent methyltransferase